MLQPGIVLLTLRFLLSGFVKNGSDSVLLTTIILRVGGGILKRREIKSCFRKQTKHWSNYLQEGTVFQVNRWELMQAKSGSIKEWYFPAISSTMPLCITHPSSKYPRLTLIHTLLKDWHLPKPLSSHRFHFLQNLLFPTSIFQNKNCWAIVCLIIES